MDNSVFECVELLQKKLPGFTPKAALILGSGLGEIADGLQGAVSINYRDLPGFPVSGVTGHAGELTAGELSGVKVLVMKGRGHYYEGKGMAVMTTPVRVFKKMGCEFVFITNAAGSLRKEVGPGSLVTLSDHINFMPESPLVGTNDERFGPRFFSMANAYDKELKNKIIEVAKSININLFEGVYASYTGPNFETPAEIKMMGILGCDVVGMSVVPEVISARHCGLKVLAVSAITNYAEGLGDVELSHEQTLKYAAIASQDFIKLIKEFFKSIKG